MEAEFNLYVDQGVTFKYPMTLTDSVTGLPIDLSEVVVKASMKQGYRSTVSYDFVCNVGVNGAVELVLPAETTIGISGRFVWDGFYFKNSETIKFAKGIVVISPTVTRLI